MLRNNRQELITEEGATRSMIIKLSIIQYFFQNYPVLLTHRGRTISTACYYIPNQSELLNKFELPLLDQKINLLPEVKTYLNIHTELTATEYFQFLETISSKSNSIESLTLNSLYLALFQAILSSSATVCSELTQQLADWNGNLPTESNDFKPKKELFGFSLKEIEIGNSAFWLRIFSSLNETDMNKLYQLFSLTVITEKEVSFFPNKSTIDYQIRLDLLAYLEYISAVEAFITNQGGQFLHQIYMNKINQLTFYQVEEIFLILKNTNAPPLQNLMFAHDGNSVYLKFGLNPLTFNSFCHFLSKYLNLSKKTQDILKMILSFRNHDYIKWYLEQQGYNLDYNNSPLISPIKKQDEFKNPAFTSTEIGNIGENYVFNLLYDRLKERFYAVNKIVHGGEQSTIIEATQPKSHYKNNKYPEPNGIMAKRVEWIKKTCDMKITTFFNNNSYKVTLKFHRFSSCSQL